MVAYKLDKGSIRCINRIYRRKIRRKTTVHDIIVATSGFGAMLVALVAMLCMETSTWKAFIVATISLAWAMLFMVVNADVINRRIMKYWRDKQHGRI